MGEFKGRVHRREIEAKPVEITATQEDTWIRKVLESAAPSSDLTGITSEEWASRCRYKIDLTLQSAGSVDVMANGTFEAQVPGTCSRCADLFDVPRKSEFRIILHRLQKGEGESDEDSGDADYIFIDQDEIDLVPILSEQLAILEPMAECPARRPDNSCVLCGKCPQFAGQAHESKADSPFSKLKLLRG